MTTRKDGILFTTRFPFSIPFGVVIDVIAISSFSYYMIIGKIPIMEGLVYMALLMALVDLFICRYAGKVIFQKDIIRIRYFFPWRKSYEIGVEKVKSLRTETSAQDFLSNYSIIIFTLDNGEIERKNIVSWYGLKKDVKVIEEKFNAVYHQ